MGHIPLVTGKSHIEAIAGLGDLPQKMRKLCALKDLAYSARFMLTLTLRGSPGIFHTAL